MWPETAILPSHEAIDTDQFWYEKGLLSFMGYHVGQKGVTVSARQQILDFIYNKPVPNRPLAKVDLALIQKV